MQTHKKIFFPNLNGVRAIAAFMVIVYHVEDIKELFGLPNFPHHDPMGNDLGGLGVTLFFVLSGFLITYLLLNEKSACGTVSLRDFYIRRVLRIWPLYYLIVVFARAFRESTLSRRPSLIFSDGSRLSPPQKTEKPAFTPVFLLLSQAVNLNTLQREES